MSKGKYKDFFIFVICLSLCAFVFLTGCRKNGQTETSDILNFSDQTTEAAQLVAGANEDLNKIKVLYKQNEDKREDLKAALKDNDGEKVKKVADDLVYIINDGMALGESAIGKIEKAQEMNINADFNEYLGLKVQSLRKQMDAFENYKQAARFLRDGYTPKDDKQRANVKLEFAKRDENFQKTMEVARDYGKQANELAKESVKKDAQK
ncbi:MAG: hypothetical protein M3033_04420 [Acidobacteriota bacterium]|nr:hypothetical protein [Acidobacteriota bacterium]